MHTYNAPHREAFFQLRPHLASIRLERNRWSQHGRDRSPDPSHDDGVNCPTHLSFHRLLCFIWNLQASIDKPYFVLGTQGILKFWCPLSIVRPCKYHGRDRGCWIIRRGKVIRGHCPFRNGTRWTHEIFSTHIFFSCQIPTKKFTWFYCGSDTMKDKRLTWRITCYLLYIYISRLRSSHIYLDLFITICVYLIYWFGSRTF